MFKNIMFPFVWWLRIAFKCLTRIMMMVGSWIATAHAVCFIWELYTRNYKVTLDENFIGGIAVHNKTNKHYMFYTLEGALHEIKESQTVEQNSI